LAKIDTDSAGQGQAAYFATFNELFNAQDKETARGLLHSQLNQWADDAVAGGGFQNKTALRSQLELYRHWILNDNVAYAELFMDVSPKAVQFSVWGLLPFTRGASKAIHSPTISGSQI
jgi:hypothetical protein